ncbi:MAG: sulfite exporter TauE/SafE family protein [Clostridia bacterium]|nr:sulfite exporter TauE/SafE family protein [Clostridia bacterium]
MRAYEDARRNKGMKVLKKINKKAVYGGLGLGAVNGLFGGGGGMIAVPILADVLGYPRKQAHATAILIIAPVCAVSAITYILNGFVDLPVVIPAAIGNVVGGLLGAKLLGKLPKIWVDIVFIGIMLAAGIRMVIG